MSPSANTFWTGARVSRLLTLLLICFLASLLAACDLFSPTVERPAMQSETPLTISPGLSPVSGVPPALPTSSSPAPVNATMSEAWGEQISEQVEHIPVQPDPNTFLLVQSVTQDGKYLLATLNPSDSESIGKQQSPIVLVDIATGQASEVARTPGSKSAVQAYGVVSDDQWIVWTQAPQEPGFFSDWVLYAYNRSDHSTKEVARAARNKDGMPALGSDGSGQIDHGMLVWTEAVPDLTDSRRNLVKLMDMATGEVTTVSSNGLSPKISWPYLAWVELQSIPAGSPTPRPGELHAQVMLLNLASGTVKALTKPGKPSSFALYKDSFVWISNDGKRVMLTDVDESFEQTIAVAQGGNSFENPSLNDRVITWGEQLGQVVVWDRKQNRLVSIGPTDAGNQFVWARTLVWSGPFGTSGTKSEINFLDTTQLP